MQMLNLFKLNRIKKSHTLLIGSFFIFIGIISLFWNYFVGIKDDVYSDMRIAMMDNIPERINDVSKIDDVPITETIEKEEDNNNYVIDYSKYLGVLEIPNIGLKRGFYNIDSKYNSIEYNVTMIEGSTLPDVENGNLILIAHSGTAYISYFAYLWKLGIGDHAYVTYNGRKYDYQIVNIYDIDKNGIAVIHRNLNRTTLTMITCTKDNDFKQTVYIAELVG